MRRTMRLHCMPRGVRPYLTFTQLFYISPLSTHKCIDSNLNEPMAWAHSKLPTQATFCRAVRSGILKLTTASPETASIVWAAILLTFNSAPVARSPSQSNIDDNGYSKWFPLAEDKRTLKSTNLPIILVRQMNCLRAQSSSPTLIPFT